MLRNRSNGLRVQIARRSSSTSTPGVEHRGRHDRQLLLLTAGTVDNVAVVQMFDVNARSRSRMRRRISLGSMPAFSQGNASSSVEFAWKYCVFGFWNTDPTSVA